MEAALNKASTIKLLEIDPWLKPFEYDIRLRMDRYTSVKRALLGAAPDLKSIANGHLFFGFHPADGGWYYREWAPGAEALNLIGDFNEWNTEAHPLKKRENGCWEIFLPGEDALTHMSRVKVHVKAKGISRDRIPLYIKRIDKDSGTGDFAGQIWQPAKPFRWTDGDFYVDHSRPLFIYEAHVGMAQEKEGIGTFREFTDNMLCRVKANGYNTIQLMAIMEHPYYGSFGYQVSNFFAVSSWMGTPDDLKELINTAHRMGITVLLDLVHSHSVKNFAEGINEFDGTDYQFFHSGSSGDHPAWDSKLFNYGKHEVMHFLLSNIKFWLEEYHFDGFRFDGVTSMLYKHHGLGVAFDNYKKYFNMDTDLDAVTYLQFANELAREVRPDAVTIAEDMSGMPGMCLPIEYGGIGFDYRLAMGVPDFWINTLRRCSDEEWSMRQMWHELTTRRPAEKNIGYAESHDQALVGDKTIMFWLADKEMYWHMMKGDSSLHVDRAISLHKLIRFITMTLAGEGYLNFMGNEFGHPEWIDFPREGNGWSYKYARRQWSLAESSNLKYEYLYSFDREMLSFAKSYNIPGTGYARNLWIDERDKLMAYSKGGVVFLFNFNPSTSFTQFGIPVEEEGEYRVVFDTDEQRFGGQARIARDIVYRTACLPEKGDKPGIIIYSPSRTALVLEKV